MLQRITLVTGNAGKAHEFAELLGIEVTPVKAGLTEVQALDPAAVATRKVADAYALTGEPVLVDDSALVVHEWNGLPGALVSWWLDAVGAQGILNMAAGLSDRRATAVTVLAYCDADGTRVFRGEVEGTLTTELHGESGFGYDPIFAPAVDGGHRTYAQMSAEEKNKISHRRRAVDAMREGLGIAQAAPASEVHGKHAPVAGLPAGACGPVSVPAGALLCLVLRGYGAARGLRRARGAGLVRGLQALPEDIKAGLCHVVL
jgi:XTP/dITP diphosphohydrolase